MKRKHQILTIPNLMSLFRLCLIPLIVWLYHEKEMYGLAAFALVISGITDVADGIVARRFDMVSDFGKAFDPVADKLTQFAMRRRNVLQTVADAGLSGRTVSVDPGADVSDPGQGDHDRNSESDCHPQDRNRRRSGLAWEGDDSAALYHDFSPSCMV